eukprot:Hpha_TRINITY_DN26867_c0_g1::TRINITY_DN26867_c0_g1_i1::g.17229::m.17229/K07442/TRM61, GCD14; tRNA (adenine57-N1/adenine58-N1)-methyltransferase catalytic subunit
MLRRQQDDGVIREGDLCILYESFGKKQAVRVKKGGKTQTFNGIWWHDRLIGSAYGSKIVIHGREGKVEWDFEAFVLRPTAELWTDCLRHRTQIIYAADIATIVARLNLQPGRVVVEAGTGSGSLSHSLARAVAPSGKLYTFDFHQERAETAGEEFVAHGLGDVVVSGHRDVCVQRPESGDNSTWGFGLEAGVADAVFLDVPKPHLAVPAVHHTLRLAGVFCNFSPCIEQVQRVCAALAELDFTDIRTHEVLRREFNTESTRFRKFANTPPDEAGGPSKRRRKAASGPHSPGAGGEEEEEVPADTPEVSLLHPIGNAKGHTGYLTFAHKAPRL